MHFPTALAFYIRPCLEQDIKVSTIILAINKVVFPINSQNSTSTTQVQASMDSPNSTKREELFTMFKDLSEAFVKFMMLLFAILAVKATDTGNALLVKHSGLMMAAVLVSLVNLLVFVLATVLQLNGETRSLIAVIVLGSSVSVLVSFVISSAIGWLTLSLWLFVFAVLAVAIINKTIKLLSSLCC